MTKKLGAEFLGTGWLVFGGCGSAVLAAGYPELGIGFLGRHAPNGHSGVETLLHFAQGCFGPGEVVPVAAHPK